jgi:hypothetical protein
MRADVGASREDAAGVRKKRPSEVERHMPGPCY